MRLAHLCASQAARQVSKIQTKAQNSRQGHAILARMCCVAAEIRDSCSEIAAEISQENWRAGCECVVRVRSMCKRGESDRHAALQQEQKGLVAVVSSLVAGVGQIFAGTRPHDVDVA